MGKGLPKSKKENQNDSAESAVRQQFLKDLAMEESMEISNQFPLKSSELISFFSAIEKLSSLETKLSYACRYICEVAESRSSFLVLFDGNLNITNSYYHVVKDELKDELTALLEEHFSDGCLLNPDFFSTIFNPEFQTSFSFLVSENTLQHTPPFSENVSHKKSLSKSEFLQYQFPLQHVLFTPLYDPDRLILGYIAIDFDKKPEHAEKLAALTEFLTEALEKQIFADLYNLSSSDNNAPSDFSNLAEVTERILAESNAESIADNLSKEITKLAHLKSCTVAFYDSNDHIYTFSNHQHKDMKGDDPSRPFSYSHDGRIDKYISEAIFMTQGFKLDAGYCFTAEQLSLLVYALESGMSPPKEFNESDLAESNVEDFQNNENIGLFVPFKYNKELLGYINLGTPIGEFSKAKLLAVIKKIGFLAGKVSDYLWLLKLESDKEKESRKAASAREILSTLVATSSKIHSEAPIDDKLHHVVHSVVEFFGLSYAAICTLDDHLTISHSAYAFHAQSEFLAVRPSIERRFKVGHTFSRKIITKAFSPPFKAYPCFAFKTDQLKQVLNNQPLAFESRRIKAFTGETSQATTVSLNNLNEYLNGGEKVGLVIPFYGEQHKLTGLISLGGLLLGGGVYELSELMDRLFIIVHFAEQISRDYQLYLIEEQRKLELLENQRLNKTVSSLFEIGSKIAETDNLETKLQLLSKALSTTGIDTAVACLCDPSGEVKYVKHYISSSLPKAFKTCLIDEYKPGKRINIEAYNTLFNTESFKLAPINIFCADLRHLESQMKTSPLSVFGSESKTVVELEHSENNHLPNGYENLERFLEFKHSPQQDMFVIATPITSDFSNENTLKGLLLLGNFDDDLDYDTVLKRFVIIDLFVRTITADLTNFILTENLQTESEKLLKKNQFIESLLELNVKLSEPVSRNQKIESVCQQSVANSDFSFVSAVLVDPEFRVTDYLQAKNPRLSEGKVELRPDLPNGLDRLNRPFIEAALDPKHKISQSYCFNHSDLLAQLQKNADQNTLIFEGCHLKPLGEVNTYTSNKDEDSELFEKFCLTSVDQPNSCSLLIPIQNHKNELFGFLTLGALIENVSKTKADVLDEIRLIELLVNSLAGSLENMLLTENLARWDAKFRNAAENVEYGMIITDQDSTIEYANIFMKKVLGYTDEELLKQSFFSLIDEKSLALAREFYTKALEQNTGTPSEESSNKDYEIDLLAKDGTLIPFQVITNGQYFVQSTGMLSLEGTFSILVDLRKEREIEKQKHEIETIRNNFMAMIVHDMKVPLSAIYGYSDMLKSVSPASMDTEYYEDIMNRIHQSTSNINQLVQEILDFSKYESNLVELHRQPHNLILCIDLVLDQLQLSLHKKNISIKRIIGQEDYSLEFDFDKMARAISNIISNAIKFSANDALIVIQLQQETRDEKPYALVSIKDYGEGIPESEIELIFDAYQQAQTKHGSRGTGLGLSITKQIIKLHNGKIWAESSVGEWTTVHFMLPMQVEEKSNSSG